MCHLSDRVSHLAGTIYAWSMLLHVFTSDVWNVHSIKPACRMVQLLRHDVLALSASCKKSINAAIEHDRNCCSQVRKQEMQ